MTHQARDAFRLTPTVSYGTIGVFAQHATKGTTLLTRGNADYFTLKSL